MAVVVAVGREGKEGSRVVCMPQRVGGEGGKLAMVAVVVLMAVVEGGVGGRGEKGGRRVAGACFRTLGRVSQVAAVVVGHGRGGGLAGGGIIA